MISKMTAGNELLSVQSPVRNSQMPQENAANRRQKPLRIIRPQKNASLDNEKLSACANQ